MRSPVTALANSSKRRALRRTPGMPGTLSEIALPLLRRRTDDPAVGHNLMAIFNKPVDQITPDDLGALLDSDAVENVLLEFKREAPGRDEALKKLSSFANTFGGHLVVGAEADSETGALQGLPGIEPIDGFKQRIVSWCLVHAVPPITVHVSAAIAAPGAEDRVCYVVHVPMSLTAPHFLAGRRGSYVRTDELSRRFEPKLATLLELEHLLTRRQAALLERRKLRQRSLERFAALVTTRYDDDENTTGEIGPTLHLTVTPSYPVTDLAEEEEVFRLSRETVVPWRQVGFPRMHGDRITQRGSAIVFRAGGTFSSIEVSTRGHLHYASELHGLRDGTEGIHFGALMGELVVTLRYSARMLGALAYQGPITVTIRLERCRGIPILYSRHGSMERGPSSPLDDVIEFDLDTDSDAVAESEVGVARDLLVALLFALNWADAIELNSLRALMKWAYEYNRWRYPDDD